MENQTKPKPIQTKLIPAKYDLECAQILSDKGTISGLRGMLKTDAPADLERWQKTGKMLTFTLVVDPVEAFAKNSEFYLPFEARVVGALK